jgi:outer membrane protein TolC
MSPSVIRGAWVGLLLVLPPVVSHADSPLTWSACVQAARAQHPGLIAAQKSVEAAESAIRVARSTGLPQLSASGRAAYADDSKTAGGEESYQGVIEIEQRLYDGGSTRFAVRVARAELEATLAEARQTETDILYDVRLAYADLLFAQSQIGLLEQIKTRRSDNVEMIELRYLGGQEHQGSLVLNQASLHEAEVDLVQARRTLVTSQSVLARAMGMEGEYPGLAVTGRFEDVQPPGTYDVVALSRATPAYLKAQAAYERAAAQLERTRSGNRPSVSAYGSASRYGGALDMEEDNLSAGLRLTLPLWAGGQVGAEIRQAAAQKMGAEADLAKSANAQRTSLEEALLAYRNAVDGVSVQEQFLAAQELRAAIAREQYGNGLLKFDNWDIIENDLISRQKNLLEVRRQTLRSEAAWWRACGRGMDLNAGESP